MSNVSGTPKNETGDHVLVKGITILKKLEKIAKEEYTYDINNRIIREAQHDPII